jgi:hypothetical protein
MTFGHGRKLLPVTLQEWQKVVYCTYPNDNSKHTSEIPCFSSAAHFTQHIDQGAYALGYRGLYTLNNTLNAISCGIFPTL